MGLDTSFDCWNGPYSSFNNWRRRICIAAGLGTLDSYIGFGGATPFPSDDVLTVLLDHSDCDGEIEWKICAALADRLEAVLPHVQDLTASFPYYADKTRTFIDGLRRAHEARANVEFH